MAEEVPPKPRPNGVRRLAGLTRDSDPTSSARRRVLDRISSVDSAAGDEADVPPTTTPVSPSVRPGSDPTLDPESTSASRPELRRPARRPLEPRTPTPRPTRAIAGSTGGPAAGPAAPRSSLLRSRDDGEPESFAPPPSVGSRRPRTNTSAHDDLRSAPSLSLSPRMTAIFGGLFGLATVTTIIALLIQAAPPKDERTALGSASAASSSSAKLADGQTPARPSKRRIRVRLPPPWRVSDLEKDPSVKIVSDAMDRRSFVAALGDKGVAKDQVYRILKAFEGVRKFDKSSKNDKFIVALDRETKAVKAFEYVVSPLEIYQAREENGVLAGSQLDMKIAEAEVTGSVYIGKNLTRSIEDAGLEDGLTKAIDEAFAGRMSSEGLEEGGTLRVIAIEQTALGEFAKYKQIVAIEYHPADPAAAPVRAYSFDGAHVHGYFDEKGRQPDGSGWGIPVPGAPITSHFNPKRMHPILHKIVPHTGTDFGAPSGTPIYAAFKGKITNWGPAGPCGNMAQLDHPGGIQTGYCHMSKFAPGLKLGSVVGTKQLIGYVGTTGRSTGPHLHFWAKKDGKFFDAETLHMNGLRSLPGDEREAFAARKAELDARLDALPMPEPPPPEPKDEKVAKSDDDPKKDPHGNEEPEAADKSDDQGDKGDKGDGKKSKDAKTAHASTKPDEGDDGDELVGADLGK